MTDEAFSNVPEWLNAASIGPDQFLTALLELSYSLTIVARGIWLEEGEEQVKTMLYGMSQMQHLLIGSAIALNVPGGVSYPANVLVQILKDTAHEYRCDRELSSAFTLALQHPR